MAPKQLRIYCDGVYDLFHLGHMRQLEQIKISHPDCFLIVGVCNDSDTLAHKGLPVLTHKERMDTVKHCKWVDLVVEGPWVLTPEFIKQYEIDFVAHDDEPYPSGDSADVYGWLKRDKKFLATKRTEGISTSDLIIRILEKRVLYEEKMAKKGLKIKSS